MATSFGVDVGNSSSNRSPSSNSQRPDRCARDRPPKMSTMAVTLGHPDRPGNQAVDDESMSRCKQMYRACRLQCLGSSGSPGDLPCIRVEQSCGIAPKLHTTTIVHRVYNALRWSYGQQASMPGDSLTSRRVGQGTPANCIMTSPTSQKSFPTTRYSKSGPPCRPLGVRGTNQSPIWVSRTDLMCFLTQLSRPVASI